MFVTTPQFRQPMPADLIRSDQKYWRAVTLSLEAPWYVLVYEVEYDGERMPQTTLVAWESTLLDLVALIPEPHRKGIARIERRHGPGAPWTVSWVQAIWAPAPDEAEDTGIFLLQLEGDPQVRDAHLQPLQQRGDRVRLYRAPLAPAATTPPTIPDEGDGAMASQTEVPADFLSQVPAGPVAGVLPKPGVSKKGSVSTTANNAARAERYAICQDLVEQLVDYAKRKRLEKPELPVSKLLEQVLVQVQKKRFGWGLSPAEAAWVSGRLKLHFEVRE